MMDKVLADVGHIKINVDDLIEKAGITRTKLATLTGVDYRVIRRMCSGESSRVDYDLLCRICYALECDLPDIIEYVPPKKSK